MKKPFLAALALVGIGLVFAAGSWVGWRSASAANQSAQQQKVLHYACPMHPQYHADKPGDCPSCGMRLEPVHGGDRAPGGTPLPAGLLTVSAEKQQLIGVRTAVAELGPASRTIRAVGWVEVDEDRVYRLVATADGVVRDLRPNSAGRLVERDEVLLTYYSNEFLGAQQAFYYALTTRERIRGGTSELTEEAILSSAQLRSAVDGLRNLGMSDTQIAALGTTRKLVRDIELRSPVTGYVLSRTVFPKQRLERGAELYRIADLGRLWVLADLFESDAPYVRPGAEALLTFQQTGPPVRARVSNVLPRVDRTTRTLKVRLEIDNKDMALRPDMFVKVEMNASLPPAITVPWEAVVNSGANTLVFVDRGSGHFEPRRVETGWRADDRVEIVRGLTAGERIVVSGTFLLDSESRLRLAGMDLSDIETDPVCGMTVERARAEAEGLTVAHGQATHYFCSDPCRKAFLANPAKFRSAVAAAPLPPARSNAAPPTRRQRAADTRDLPDYLRPGDDDLNTTSKAADGRTIFATDPACGAEVDTTAPDVLKSVHNGRTYYFVSAECKAEFDRDPAKYVK